MKGSAAAAESAGEMSTSERDRAWMEQYKEQSELFLKNAGAISRDCQIVVGSRPPRGRPARRRRTRQLGEREFAIGGDHAAVADHWEGIAAHAAAIAEEAEAAARAATRIADLVRERRNGNDLP
jgi:hypothetical protein